jgi:hypothetical protein
MENPGRKLPGFFIGKCAAGTPVQRIAPYQGETGWPILNVE